MNDMMEWSLFIVLVKVEQLNDNLFFRYLNVVCVRNNLWLSLIIVIHCNSIFSRWLRLHMKAFD